MVSTVFPPGTHLSTIWHLFPSDLGFNQRRGVMGKAAPWIIRSYLLLFRLLNISLVESWGDFPPFERKWGVGVANKTGERDRTGILYKYRFIGKIPPSIPAKRKKGEAIPKGGAVSFQKVLRTNKAYISFLWASQVVLVVKNPPAKAGSIRDTSSIPGSGRSPGEEHGNPLQYSYPENPTDRGAWQATVHGVA